MRRKLFLLSVAVERSTMSLPLAAGILKAELDAAASLQGSLETQLLDLTLADSSASAAESVREPGALVGVSAYLWNETWLLDFARSLRSALPGAVLFAGGPQAQAAPAAFFEAGYSFVAAGDGEALIVPLLERLLRGETPSDLPGILTAEAFAALSGAAPGSGFAPVFLDDLGGRPSPFLSGSLDLLSHPGVLWETTRGCPYSCAFCYESRGRKQVRLRPLETLEAELALFAASGVRRVFVLDPSFNVNRKRALEVLGLIARTAPELSFTFEIRGEALDEELAEAFARIGSSLQIGLQSSDPEVLRQVDRDFNSVRFTEGCSLLREAGAVYGFDLIYGLPGDSFEGFLRSLDFALGLVPANLDVFPLAVLPGTVLADKASSWVSPTTGSRPSSSGGLRTFLRQTSSGRGSSKPPATNSIPAARPRLGSSSSPNLSASGPRRSSWPSPPPSTPVLRSPGPRPSSNASTGKGEGKDFFPRPGATFASLPPSAGPWKARRPWSLSRRPTLPVPRPASCSRPE